MKTDKFSLAGKLLFLSLLVLRLSAIEVNIKEGLPFVDVDINGEAVRIERIQDTSNKLKNSYTKTSRPAPPFSIQPFQPIKGIGTVTELDVIDFISKELSENRGLLVDARMPKWHQVGTIPGAINIPLFLYEEHALIGKTYKQEGKEKAIDIAIDIVEKGLKRILNEAKKLDRDKLIVVFCARGGMRSQTMAVILRLLGFNVKRLIGGFKAYKHAVKD